MGGKLSQPQERHVSELLKLVRINFFIFKPSGGEHIVISKGNVKKLLQEIWWQCPWYPERGSLKLDTWRKIGTILHEEPRATAEILTYWKVVMTALETQQQPLLKPLVEPSPYKGVVLHPPTPKLEDVFPPPTAPTLVEEKPQPQMGKIQAMMHQAFNEGKLEPDEIPQMDLFPVNKHVDAQGNLRAEWVPIPLAVLREIKKAVKDYGIQSPFTKGLLTSLASSRMIPNDWKDLMRMILSSTQYVVFDSEYQREAINRGRNSGGLYTAEQIYGAGLFESTADQATNLPDHVFPVIMAAVLGALCRIQDVGTPARSFSQIKQTASESYNDFVERLQLAITRQISNEEAARELLLKLAVENANADCKRILQPLVARGEVTLADLLKACAVVGSQAYNMETLAMALQKGMKPTGSCRKGMMWPTRPPRPCPVSRFPLLLHGTHIAIFIKMPKLFVNNSVSLLQKQQLLSSNVLVAVLNPALFLKE